MWRVFFSIVLIGIDIVVECNFMIEFGNHCQGSMFIAFNLFSFIQLCLMFILKRTKVFFTFASFSFLVVVSLFCHANSQQEIVSKEIVS